MLIKLLTYKIIKLRNSLLRLYYYFVFNSKIYIGNLYFGNFKYFSALVFWIINLSKTYIIMIMK